MAYRRTAITLATDTVADLLARAQTLDLAPGPGGRRGSDDQATAVLFRAPLSYLFPAAVLYRVFALYPGSQIELHTDPPIRGMRYHLPLQSNDACWCCHDGVWSQLTPGFVYVMDPSRPHGAVNWGETLRLHLTIDQE